MYNVDVSTISVKFKNQRRASGEGQEEVDRSVDWCCASLQGDGFRSQDGPDAVEAVVLD